MENNEKKILEKYQYLNADDIVAKLHGLEHRLDHKVKVPEEKIRLAEEISLVRARLKKLIE